MLTLVSWLWSLVMSATQLPDAENNIHSIALYILSLYSYHSFIPINKFL
jgi:hypothetical protein